jgi:hypothetical protein
MALSLDELGLDAVLRICWHPFWRSFVKNKQLPPLFAGPVGACSVCDGAQVNWLGSKDFGVSCGDHFEGGRLYADYGVQIPYFECLDCGFVFTNAFDDWTHEEFADHIYNNDYAHGDKPYLGERPARNASMVAALFHHQKDSMRVLDFGGGNSVFTDELLAAGMDATSYDPYGQGEAPSGKYDLITGFEVLEHVVHHKLQAQLVEIAGHLKPGKCARIMLSTETVEVRGDFGWWYISPRNGHVSIHTMESLQTLARRAGLQLDSINSCMHMLSALAT